MALFRIKERRTPDRVRFFLQHRCCFIWWNLQESIGWDCSTPYVFRTLKDAQDRLELIKRSLQIKVTYH